MSDLLPLPCPFYNGYVSIRGKVDEALDFAAGLRPLYFQPIHFLVPSEPKDQAGIMRRKIASSANFRAVSNHVSCFVSDLGADGVDIRLLADELQAQPMVLSPSVIPEQER